MEHKPASSVLTLLSCLLFLSVFSPGWLIAQEKGPVFWTHGGNWGNWLKITAHPGLAIRTACGDDSTLNNYPVSSTDWQLRNGYTEPMAVVWRVQFFNDTSGKNEMSGWMLEHFKAGEVSDGWNVEAGHCKAINVISVQVKCAVRDGDEAKCYNSDGNPYPPRPADAYRGDHNPSSSLAGSKNGSNSASKLIQGAKRTGLGGTTWSCRSNDFPGHVTEVLHFNADGTVRNSNDPDPTRKNEWTQSSDDILWKDTHDDGVQIEYSGKKSGETIVFQLNSRSGSGGESKFIQTNTCKNIDPEGRQPMSWTQTAEAKYISTWDCYAVHSNSVYVSDAPFSIYVTGNDDERFPILNLKWENWIGQKYHIMEFAEGGCGGDVSGDVGRAEENRQRTLSSLKIRYPQATFITVHWSPN